MNNKKSYTSRRKFLKVASVGAVAAILPPPLRSNQSQVFPEEKSTENRKLKLGIASYTFRKFNLDETIQMTKRVGMKRIAFKSFHLPLESTKNEIKTVVSQVEKAGLLLYGAGVIYMKDEDEVIRAFEYAKTAGLHVIIGVPEHHLLGLINEKVKAYDIKLAIHNHGPGDERYPSPQSAIEKIKSLDSRIGLCMDIGHVARYGLDPVSEIKKYANHLHDVHIKDVSAPTKDGKTVEIGRGIIDTPEILKTLQSFSYQGTVAFEYEKDEEDPLPGLAESVGYVNGVLDVI
jgi:inosose dehydratase